MIKMSMVESIGDTNIHNVRLLLNQMGNMENILEEDEYQISKGKDTIYTDYGNIIGVDGVWLASDTEHSGTNYGLSGTYNPLNRTVTLTNDLPALNTPVLITYARSVGLSDSQIELAINSSEIKVMNELMDFDFTFTMSTNIGKVGLYLVYFLAHLEAIHIMNTGNAVQGGFSYMMNQLQVNTKLWGEGMSAEALINFYVKRCKEMMTYLKFNSGPLATFGALDYRRPNHYTNNALLNDIGQSQSFQEYLRYGYITIVE